MGVRRQARQERSWPAIHWQTPSLFIAIVTLVAVTGAVLSDAPRWPFKAVPSEPEPATVVPFDPQLSPDATPLPGATSSLPAGRWMVQNTAVSAVLVDISCADGSHCIAG